MPLVQYENGRRTMSAGTFLIAVLVICGAVLVTRKET